MSKMRMSAWLVLAAAFAVAFSWRLHFHQAYMNIERPHFRTLDQFAPPASMPMHLKSVSQWGLESRALSPWRVFYWLCGRDVGMNLELPVHLAIGVSGGWMLARALGMNCLAAMTCAVVWPSSSWMYLHFEAGHLTFLFFFYLPWIFTALLMGLWWAIGGMMALMFFEGGVWPMFYITIAVTDFVLSRCLVTHSLKPLAIIIAAAFFATVLSLAKFVHIPHGGASFDEHDSMEHVSGEDYFGALFSSDQTQFRWAIWDDVGSMPWWEIGAYVSPFFIPLIIIGATPGWSLAAVTALALSFGGYFGRWSPYCVFHALPIVRNTWMATHWLIIMTFCLGVMAARGMERSSKTRTGTITGCSLLCAGLVQSWMVSTAGLGMMN